MSDIKNPAALCQAPTGQALRITEHDYEYSAPSIGLESVTNTEFIHAIFDDRVPNGAAPAVVSKLGNPKEGGYIAQQAYPCCEAIRPDANNYVNVGAFWLADDGTIAATKANSVGAFALLLDDIGDKVEPSVLERLEPSSIIQTSASSSQAVYILEPPLTPPEAEMLWSAVRDAGLTDPSAGGPLTRWMRLPVGVNGKPEHCNPDPFQCRLKLWRPSNRYTIAEIADAFQLNLTPLDNEERQAAPDRGFDRRGSTPYGEAALADEMEKISRAEEGSRNDQLNKSSFKIGQLVGENAVDQDAAKNKLLGAALTAGLDLNESQKTIRSGLDAGMRSPRPKPKADCRAREKGDAPEAVLDVGDDGPSSTASEQYIADHFIANNPGRFLYVKAFGKWMVWDGTRWAQDEKMVASNTIVRSCRMIAKSKGNEPSVQRHLESYKTAYGAEQIARTYLAASSDQWDADIWALNTPDGLVNLRDGSIRTCLPEDYVTKRTLVSPGGKCPRFLKFLDEIFEGDKELIAFIRRIFGCSLTGSIRDHALFFGYGSGGNGKGVLTNVIAGIMGDYHAPANAETFTESKNPRHLSEIARLRGARLVTIPEMDRNRQWAEGLIKALTGGTPMVANFMRCDHFEFMPQFKPFFTGNHLPKLRGVDESIRRRFHIIPFSATFKKKKDTSLEEKLMEEASGILAWAIEGCLEWQRIGLQPPSAVTSLTEDYLVDQDMFGAWLTAMCEFSKIYETPGGDLYRSFSSFCMDRSGEVCVSPNSFPGKLLERGIRRKKTKTNNSYVGIRLLPLPATVPPEQTSHTNDTSFAPLVSTIGGGGGTTTIMSLTRACSSLIDMPPPPPPDDILGEPRPDTGDNAAQGQAVAGNGRDEDLTSQLSDATTQTAVACETTEDERTADGRLVVQL